MNKSLNIVDESATVQTVRDYFEERRKVESGECLAADARFPQNDMLDYLTRPVRSRKKRKAETLESATVENTGDESETESKWSVSEAELVPVSEIEADGFFRVRVKEKASRIEEFAGLLREYQEELAEGQEVEYPFEPVTYLISENHKILHTGFHRFFAARKAGLDSIPMVRFSGSRSDAVKYAVKDNRKHGLPYEHGDFQVAITKILKTAPNTKLEELRELTGASKTHCSQTRTRFMQERKQERFTSEPTANAEMPTEGDNTHSVPSKRKNIVYWKRLGALPPNEQIKSIIDTLITFTERLDSEDRQLFRDELAVLLEMETSVAPSL